MSWFRHRGKGDTSAVAVAVPDEVNALTATDAIDQVRATCPDDPIVKSFVSC